ncbi:MAG: CBS domain-containing protein [Arenimonas sp.]|nr:CBS domain-containing protein [Arenimonas sp.]
MKNMLALLNNKSAQIHSVGSNETVLDAIKLMAEKHIGSVLVMDNGQLVGIATERDYARKVILLGRNSNETPVSSIMSYPVMTVLPTDTVSHCMTLMNTHKIRHLPVLDNNQIIGLISIGDLVKAVIEQQQLEINQLQNYIAG